MALFIILGACQPVTPPDEEPEAIAFFRGADLSYVNEMQDCGGMYQNAAGEEADPYALFAEAGTNLVRLRLWHNPDLTDYSTLADVKKSIRRAKEAGMQVLLDFHYSDDWADPNKQEIPAAWLAVIDDTAALSDSLYHYTYHTLIDLIGTGLAPDLVQVGNEINPMILQQGELSWPIDWVRNATLLNRGLQAVRDAAMDTGDPIETMLHIAQPENGLWWFEEATEAGVTQFDWIGLSYYPKWSEYKLDAVGDAFRTLRQTYGKKLMVVETAYPFTLENIDAAGNILGQDALIDGFPATEAGQRAYMEALEDTLKAAGGAGLVYWEPAWVTNACSTRWGQGSHWDNATFFNHDHQPTQAMQWYGRGAEE